MINRKLTITMATGVLCAGLFSASASAYGPRDNMSYPHPAQMPMTGDCPGERAQVRSHNPRTGGLHQVCRANRSDRSALRIDNSGPRPRTVVEKTSRRATRVSARR